MSRNLWVMLMLPFALLTAAVSRAEARFTGVDPLTAVVQVEDVERFAKVMARTAGKPTAADLQRDYLDPGSEGIGVFTPGRIENADRLAAAIAAHPDEYAVAIERCLPWAKEATADLRSIYLGLQGALPRAKLPQIFIVMGARNSGGTAAPYAQVLGLEVLCRIAPTREAFRKTLRHFFAHETVHSLQQQAGVAVRGDALLTQVLIEGAADFVARLVTGEEPDPERARWAAEREADLWRQFKADVDLTRLLESEEAAEPGSSQQQAVKRWIGNYRSAPQGWPGELGYWMGLRIWERHYARSKDKRATLSEMLTVRQPRDVLASGGFVQPIIMPAR